MKKTAQKSVAGEKVTAKGELQQNIWAVTDDSGCRLLDVTYDEARASVSEVPGTIMTTDAARRIS